jgi:hypothetical protein
MAHWAVLVHQQLAKHNSVVLCHLLYSLDLVLCGVNEGQTRGIKTSRIQQSLKWLQWSFMLTSEMF